MTDPRDDDAIPARRPSLSAEPALDRAAAAAAEIPPTGFGDEQFRHTLDVLLRQIDSLPAAERERLRSAADATRQRHEQLKLTVARLQETLDQLRLSVKYLIFDVEATRRENDYLRKMLEESRGDD